MSNQPPNPISTSRPTGTGSTFEATFRKNYDDIDYTAAPDPSQPTLPIPLPTDTIKEAMNKLRALADVVRRGKSVAVATGYKGTISEARNPVDIAKAGMTDGERQQYEAWDSGCSMPTYDWTQCIKPLKGGAGTQTRFQRRAEAAQKVWSNPDITPENIYWIAEHDPFIMPLIIAVAKVDGAKRNLLGGQNNLTEYELAEVQTIHKACAAFTDIQNAVNAELNLINRTGNEAKEELQAREHAIKSKNPAYKTKQDPVNTRRARVGLPAIGAGVDFGAGTRGARVARTDLLSGIGLNPRRVAPTDQPEGSGRATRRRRVNPSQDEPEMDY